MPTVSVLLPLSVCPPSATIVMYNFKRIELLLDTVLSLYVMPLIRKKYFYFTIKICLAVYKQLRFFEPRN